MLLALLAIPAIHRAHLPLHMDWRLQLQVYWLTLGIKSVFLALIFCLLGFPFDFTVRPFLERCRRRKLFPVFLIVLLTTEIRILGTFGGIILFGDALLLIELALRSLGHARAALQRFAFVILIAAYLFCGIVLVLIYNDVIVALRPHISYDALFNRLDTHLLFGHNVSGLAHTAFAAWPPGLFTFLDHAYFQMFLVVGAALLITSYCDTRRGFQFVGACLTAYYFSLIVFYLWPTYGPFFACLDHLARYPSHLWTYRFQKGSLSGPLAIWNRTSTTLATGFYIAFPSLHIALPVIAMWFLRRRRNLFVLIAAYNLLLMFAIPLLEWHYVIDLLGGVALAALAIAIVSCGQPWARAPRAQLARMAVSAETDKAVT